MVHASRFRKLLLTGGIVFWLLLFLASGAFAQQWPTKPVRLIVPFAPGGPSDTVARILGTKLTEQWHQPVVIENKPGADGIIASEFVAKSAPDGHLLLLANDGILIVNPLIYPKLPYDPVGSFAPITTLTRQPFLIVVNAESSFKSARELIDYAKANPGKLNQGAGASNAAAAGAFFKLATGTQMVLIRFKGVGPQLQALLSGTIDVAFTDTASALSLVRAGRLRPLATTGLQRTTALSDVPTVAEVGYRGFEMQFWNSVLVAAGTPVAIVRKLNADIRVAFADPDAVGKLAGLGFEPNTCSQEEMSALIAADTQKLRNTVVAAGVQLE